MESLDPLANLKLFGSDISKEIEEITKKEALTKDPAKKSVLASKKAEKEGLRREIINAVKTQTAIEKEAEAFKNMLRSEGKLLSELPSSKLVAKASQTSIKSSTVSSLKSRTDDLDRFSGSIAKVDRDSIKIKDYATEKVKEIDAKRMQLEKKLAGCESELEHIRRNFASMDPMELESCSLRLDSQKVLRRDLVSNIEKLRSKRNEFDSVKDNAILNSVKHYLKVSDEIAEENAVRTIINDNKISKMVDLCFLMDATGSMDDWLKKTKEKTLDIIKAVRDIYADANFRVAVVVYRDFDMGDKSFEVLDFTEDAFKVPQFLEFVKADGGEDQAEDINGGFQLVLQKIRWQSLTKVLIHFADAPCHGATFGSRIDDHPNPSSDMKWDLIFREVKSLGIDYNFMKINDSTNVMIREFTKLWSTVGRYYGTNQKKIEFKVYPITIETNDFVNKIKSVIIDSISRSLSYMRTGVAARMRSDVSGHMGEIIVEGDEEEDPGSFAQPDWTVPKHKWQEKEGEIISVSVKPIADIIKNGFKIFHGEWKVAIQMTPFASGTFNSAHAATQTSTGHKIVAKKPRTVDENLIKLDLKKKGIAISLARDFNRALVKLKVFKWARIFFIQDFLFKSAADPNDLWLLEGYIDGEFKKYSNNLDEIDLTQEIRHFTAFAHYSYERSGGQYLVTDFQGVGSFLLTDPALHSRTKEFIESGDFGIEGFIRFFSKHQCNDICKGLGLRRPDLKLVECGKWSEREFPHDKSKIRRKCWVALCNNILKDDRKEKHCDLCANWIAKEQTVKCAKCEKKFSYSSYYYLLSALKNPKMCPDCCTSKKRFQADLFREDDEDD